MPGSRDFTELVGCRLPIQLASMGAIGTPELAAAVSEAGGLGTVPNPSSADEASELVERARALTAKPLGVGFLIPFVDREAVEAAAQAVEVIEFFYGDPDPRLVEVARGDGALVAWQTGSAREARAAQDAGCDFVIAQGVEAGGHVQGTQPLDAVLAQTLAEVTVPVVAAGGVGTAERVAELLAAGAAAIRIGTRFIAAEEADAHPRYVEALIGASPEDTVFTESFAAGWPEAPHRVLRSALEAAERRGDSSAGRLGEAEIPGLAPVPPTREVQGEIGAMALYAGESVGAVKRVQPAGEIVAELTALIPGAAS